MGGAGLYTVQALHLRLQLKIDVCKLWSAFRSMCENKKSPQFYEMYGHKKS